MSKFNKQKCRNCVYGRLMGTKIICNFATVTDTTCLHIEEDKVVDYRGSDYNNCKLYKRGKAIDNQKW